jgi:hypothetical protein
MDCCSCLHLSSKAQQVAQQHDRRRGLREGGFLQLLKLLQLIFIQSIRRPCFCCHQLPLTNTFLCTLQQVTAVIHCCNYC